MAIKKSQEVCLLTLLGLALAGCRKKHSPKSIPKNSTARCESHKNSLEQRFVTASSNTENTVQEGLPSTSPTDTTAASKIAVVATPQKATDVDVGNAAVGAGQLGATAAVGDEEGPLPHLLVQDGSLAEEEARLSSLEEEEELGATDTEGDDALHAAAEKRIRILRKVGTDVNAKDEPGKTPLHYAMEKGTTKVATILACKGASIK